MSDLYDRVIRKQLEYYFKKGMNVLLLGPRQVGKTTIAKTFKFDLNINLSINKERLFYEKNLDFLSKRIESLAKTKGKKTSSKKPFIYIDEIQKVPALLDELQALIDDKKAQFLITGSSARKLKNEIQTNMIPGRVLNLRMDGISYFEKPESLNLIFQYGQLPQILSEKDKRTKELLLRSYIENYIEDEIRKETKIRNIANYARFIELAAIQAGRITNFSEVSKELGPTVQTIQSYYQVLEDTLFVDRIEPYLKNTQRKKLTKSSKYLFFDLGVRRICAGEGMQMLPERHGEIFEHFVGNEILKWIRGNAWPAKLYYWRDSDGPEVDYVLECEGHLLPIEVKYKDNVGDKDAKHLRTFLNEYTDAQQAIVIYKNDVEFKIASGIQAVSYRTLSEYLNQWVAGL